MQKQLFRTFKKNPYATLGVLPTSSKSEIKVAYYRLAKRFHPDINSSNKVSFPQEYFREITEAYKTLQEKEFKAPKDFRSEEYEAPMPRPSRRFRTRSNPTNNSKSYALFEILTVA